MTARGLAVVCLAMGALLMASVASALACTNEGAYPGAVSAQAYSRAVQCLVNEQRAAVGLRGLWRDRRLARAAQRFSDAMVRERFFDHVSPEGSTLGQRARAAGYAGRMVGETLGWGSGELATPAAIVAGWMASPPHHAILMTRQFRRIGLGVTSGSPEGDADAATVTADFGT
jgi:uncharacterized protein YkwD